MKCTECGSEFTLKADEPFPEEINVCYTCQYKGTPYFDDDYDFDGPDDFDDEESEWDDTVDECGLLPPHLGGVCMKAGSEHCDFECPFRDNPGLLTGEEP